MLNPYHRCKVVGVLFVCIYYGIQKRSCKIRMCSIAPMTIPIKSASKSNQHQWLPVERESPNSLPMASPAANSGGKTEAMRQTIKCYILSLSNIFSFILTWLLYLFHFWSALYFWKIHWEISFSFSSFYCASCFFAGPNFLFRPWEMPYAFGAFGHTSACLFYKE